MNTVTHPGIRVFTIGHSTRPLDDFVALLHENGITQLVDIRRYPGSHKWPHFNKEPLADALAKERVFYVWLEHLGGRRHGLPRATSPNQGLTSDAFRNYADYLADPGFQHAVTRLVHLAGAMPTAIMCAEKLFWKCHRRILSDYLAAQGVSVIHIIDRGRTQAHTLSAGAVVTATGAVIYPPAQGDLFCKGVHGS